MDIPEIETAKLQKLNLEIESLKWQNGRAGRAMHLVPVFTVVATIGTIIFAGIGVWLGFAKFTSDNRKDRELREKELSQRIDSQYRADINQLLRFPVDEKTTIPMAIFLLKDLSELIELQARQATVESNPEDVAGKLEEIRKQQGDKIALLLYSLIKSEDFTFAEPHNVEFEVAALRYWNHYAMLLDEDPLKTKEILSKYKQTLTALHDLDSRCYEGILVYDSTGGFYSPIAPKDPKNYIHFLKLCLGYKEHVDQVRRRVEQHAGGAETEEVLRIVDGWFFDATKNPSISNHVFGTKRPIPARS